MIGNAAFNMSTKFWGANAHEFRCASKPEPADLVVSIDNSLHPGLNASQTLSLLRRRPFHHCLPT